MSKRERDPVPLGASASQARALDWIEAALWVALIVVGSLVATAVLRDHEARTRPRASAAPAPSGLIEAEDLPVIARSRDFTFWLQPTSGFLGGNWSKDGHMFANTTAVGDFVDLRLPRFEPGEYDLVVYLTKAADYGIVAVSVNEIELGRFDLLSLREVLPTGPLKAGRVHLRGRKNALRLEIVGKNPNAAPPFYQFGIDGVRLVKAAQAKGGAAKRAASDAEAAKPTESGADEEQE